MSFVDGLKHRLVGHFGSKPLYWVLEQTFGFPHDFECPANTLVLGRGGGETPAITLDDPVKAAAMALAASEPELAKRKWRDALEPWLGEGQPITYSGWIGDDRETFIAMCRSSAMLNPFWDDLPEAEFDHWLACSLGEFVVFAMPDLAKDLLTAIDIPDTALRHVRYNNIQLPLPHQPLYANGGSAWDMKFRD